MHSSLHAIILFCGPIPVLSLWEQSDVSHVIVGTTSNHLVEPMTRHTFLPVLQLYLSSFVLIPHALTCLVWLPCRLLNPLGMFTAMAVVSGVFLASVWAGENRPVINQFKRQNPTAFVITVMVASYILVSMLGSVMVFMSAITLPLACKFKKIMLENFMVPGR